MLYVTFLEQSAQSGLNPGDLKFMKNRDLRELAQKSAV
jgi:hypothetical protein